MAVFLCLCMVNTHTHTDLASRRPRSAAYRSSRRGSASHLSLGRVRKSRHPQKESLQEIPRWLHNSAIPCHRSVKHREKLSYRYAASKLYVLLVRTETRQQARLKQKWKRGSFKNTLLKPLHIFFGFFLLLLVLLWSVLPWGIMFIGLLLWTWWCLLQTQKRILECSLPFYLQ